MLATPSQNDVQATIGVDDMMKFKVDGLISELNQGGINIKVNK